MGVRETSGGGDSVYLMIFILSINSLPLSLLTLPTGVLSNQYNGALKTRAAMAEWMEMEARKLDQDWRTARRRMRRVALTQMKRKGMASWKEEGEAAEEAVVVEERRSTQCPRDWFWKKRRSSTPMYWRRRTRTRKGPPIAEKYAR